jgi:hypothetical protein
MTITGETPNFGRNVQPAADVRRFTLAFTYPFNLPFLPFDAASGAFNFHRRDSVKF